MYIYFCTAQLGFIQAHVLYMWFQGIAVDGDTLEADGQGDAVQNGISLIKRKGKVQALVDEIQSKRMSTTKTKML